MHVEDEPQLRRPPAGHKSAPTTGSSSNARTLPSNGENDVGAGFRSYLAAHRREGTSDRRPPDGKIPGNLPLRNPPPRPAA